VLLPYDYDNSAHRWTYSSTPAADVSIYYVLADSITLNRESYDGLEWGPSSTSTTLVVTSHNPPLANPAVKWSVATGTPHPVVVDPDTGEVKITRDWEELDLDTIAVTATTKDGGEKKAVCIIIKPDLWDGPSSIHNKGGF
jgi:hypothetical protein